MTFEEAFANTAVRAIRLPIWANRDTRLELPPVQDGRRVGVWCKLIDPGMREDIREQQVAAMEFMGYPDCQYDEYAQESK